jgi:hypothetical protein
LVMSRATPPPLPERDRLADSVAALSRQVEGLAETQREHGEWMRRVEAERATATSRAKSAREVAMYVGAMAGAVAFDRAAELATMAVRWFGSWGG